MAKQARSKAVANESTQRLYSMENAAVLDVLFERPSGVKNIADSINQKVDGPDLSNENLQEILARLQKSRFVGSVRTKEGEFWYLTKTAYEAMYQKAIEELRAEKRFYHRRVSALKQNNGSDYIST